MKKIGIIGLGNMGSAIYESINDNFEIYAYDPYKSKENSNTTMQFFENFSDILDNCEILLVCVKPNVVKEILEKVNKPKKIFSIAAGISLHNLKNYITDTEIRSQSKFIRLMPNLPMTVSKGCIGFMGDEEVYPEVYEVFSKLGLLVQVDSEKQMDAITGLSGSGPAFVFSFIQALAEGGVKSGLPYKNALELSIQTVIGSALYLSEEVKKGEHPYSLRNKVTSPGGTTIFGLDKLEEGRFTHTVMNSVYSSFKKSMELGS